MLGASCRGGQERKHQKPLVVPPRRKPCFAKNILNHLLFSSQLVWVFFLVFLVFFLSSRRYVKKTSKTPRRSSSAKTMLRKNIFSLLLFSTQLVWVFFPVFLVFFLHLAPFPTCPAPSRYAPSSFVGTRYDKKGRLCKIRKPLSPPLFIIHYLFPATIHYPLFIKKHSL